MAERLLFKNPEFQDGVNATFRLGDKWARRVSQEDIVEVWSQWGGDDMHPTQKLFDGFIVDVLLLNIGDIPVDVLANAHNPVSRTHAGLIERLQEVYPGKNINVRTKVTVILFENCETAPLEVI